MSASLILMQLMLRPKWDAAANAVDCTDDSDADDANWGDGSAGDAADRDDDAAAGAVAKVGVVLKPLRRQLLLVMMMLWRPHSLPLMWTLRRRLLRWWTGVSRCWMSVVCSQWVLRVDD